MPFPSRGCKTCRQRRVKCDETRPTCDRCTKHGRMCGGFDQDEGEHVFRSENERFAKRTTRLRRSTRKAIESESELRESSSSQTPNLASGFMSSSCGNNSPTLMQVISPCVTTDVEILATNEYLVHRYADDSDSMPNCLWPMLNAITLKPGSELSDSEDVFGLAFSATSLAFFAASRPISSTMALASMKYSQALAKLKTALGDIRHAISDEVLMAVMLMGQYEGILSDFDMRHLFMKAFRHMDGALTLMQLRLRFQARGHLDRSIDQKLRRQIIRQAIYRGDLIPEWLHLGARFGENGSELLLDSCLVKVAALRHKAAQFALCSRHASPHGQHQHPAEMKDILLQAKALDDMLASWTLCAPPETDLENISYGEQRRIDQGSPPALITNLTMWNRYRGARLIANYILDRFTAKMLSTKGSIEAISTRGCLTQAHIKQQMLVDEICTSVPQIMDDIESPASAPKAFVLAWPLVIAAAAPAITDDQREWVRSKLRLISKTTRCATFEKLASIDLHKRREPVVVSRPEVMPEASVAIYE